MSVDRRTFLEVAGLVGAGALLSCDSRSTETPQARTQAAVTLKLLLWGSALYAFSAGGQSVEVAYITNDPGVPGCTFVPHQPMLTFPAGGGRVVASSTTVKLGSQGEVPPGAYRISTGSVTSSSPALQAEGLAEAPSPCVSQASIKSLSLIPTLKSTSSVATNWRDRFSTRFRFDYGVLQAHAPFHGGADLARWDVKGPGTAAVSSPYTDTLLLTIPLAGSTVTFENESGGTIILEPDGDPSAIEVRLLAHPPSTSAGDLRPGDPEPHMCALYAAFEPKPTSTERSELFFKEWCAAPSPLPNHPVPTGPSPGRYCTGAKVTL